MKRRERIRIFTRAATPRSVIGGEEITKREVTFRVTAPDSRFNNDFGESPDKRRRKENVLEMPEK
jgi:hypothetical protein